VAGRTGDDAGKFMLGDDSDARVNPNGNPWGESQRRHLALWLRTEEAGEPFKVTVLARTDGCGVAQINYIAANGTDGMSGSCFNVYQRKAEMTPVKQSRNDA
jgi:hypothetical protein